MDFGRSVAWRYIDHCFMTIALELYAEIIPSTRYMRFSKRESCYLKTAIITYSTRYLHSQYSLVYVDVRFALYSTSAEALHMIP